jgi:sialic acid synthase SpsE
VAVREILKGEHFSAENITGKRSGDGISPMRWDEIIGRKANRNYRKDELIDA